MRIPIAISPRTVTATIGLSPPFLGGAHWQWLPSWPAKVWVVGWLYASLFAELGNDGNGLCSGFVHPQCEGVVVDAVPLPAAVILSNAERSLREGEVVA
jgi:hypothetical protein